MRNNILKRFFLNSSTQVFFYLTIIVWFVGSAFTSSTVLNGIKIRQHVKHGNQRYLQTENKLPFDGFAMEIEELKEKEKETDDDDDHCSETAEHNSYTTELNYSLNHYFSRSNFFITSRPLYLLFHSWKNFLI